MSATRHADTIDLMDPYRVLAKLAAIEADMAVRQNGYEHAAAQWFQAKREAERERAKALLASAHSSVTEKRAQGDLAAYSVEGAEYEAEYEATRAVFKVLELRSMVLMSILKSQGRA